MEEILSYLIFSDLEIILLATFFVLFLTQIFFYCYYYRCPLAQCKKIAKGEQPLSIKNPSVSVIVVSKNESESLSENLSSILDQDYPDFEVIVVNDGSTDESEDVLRLLSHKHTNLYHTFSPDSRDRKLSMTIAIKAAKNEILLFTEAYCKPDTKQWISSMVKGFVDESEIVLGYSYFATKKSYLKKLVGFDNLIFNLQLLSKAIKKKPYTGTYRNLAFKKDLFFENKGFSNVLNFDNCEEVFLNRIFSKYKTNIVLSQDSFISTSLPTYSTWKGLKIAYYRAKRNFDRKGSVFTIETFSRYLFYILFIGTMALGIMTQSWVFTGIVAFIFLIRWSVQIVILNKSSKYFKEPSYYFSIFIFELLQPIYNKCFSILSRRKDNQKYNSNHM